MKPKWMRILHACPECGYVLKDEYDGWSNDGIGMRLKNQRFDCPRCKAHFTESDFMKEHHDTYAHVWSDHNGENACRE